MTFKNKKIQKIISSLLITVFLVPSVAVFTTPNRAEATGIPVIDIPGNILKHIGNLFAGTSAAGTTTSTAIAVKKVLTDILHQLEMVIAKRMLADVTKRTVNWINTGNFGTPLFIQNPQSFFKDIAKTEIESLVGTIGYDPIRFPFGKQQALNLISQYKSKLGTNAAYSLSQVTNDPTLLYNYRTNFGFGGWNGFILNTQYPQNNYIGSQMQVNNQIALQLQGTSQTAAQKVQTTLQQGMGFLSPQTCTGPNAAAYNASLTNQFQRPSFSLPSGYADKNYPDDTDKTKYPLGDADPAFVADAAAYNAKVDGLKADWATTNTCTLPNGTSGLVSTTPGSVVANSVMHSLGAGQDETVLQAALGGSLSAVFDAVLNKFLGTPGGGGGLSGLATNTNGVTTPVDNFSYDGQTLGSDSSGVNGNNGDVFSGPDQVIVLDKFKKQISGETQTLSADGNTVLSSKPGNTKNGTFNDTYLDPNAPEDQTNPRISGTYVPGDIANMETEIRLMDNDASNPANPYKNEGYGITQMLALMWPKERGLDLCTPGPNIGWESRLDDEMQRNMTIIQSGSISDPSADDTYKINLAVKNLQFAVGFFKDWITNKMTIPVSQGGLGLPHSSIFLDAVADAPNLTDEMTTLTTDKRAKQQALVRLQSIGYSLNLLTTEPLAGSQEEKELISFKKQYDAVAYSISNSTTIEDTKAELNTAIDKNTNLGKLLGQCNAERTAAGWSATPAGGWTKSGGEGSTLLSAVGKPFIIQFFLGNNLTDFNPLIWKIRPIRITGNEKEQFCDLPIVSGYTHETFINPADITENGQHVPYPDIPLVNAGELAGLDPSGRDANHSPYSRGGPFMGAYGPLQSVNMQLSCNIIYQSNILDYKGSIPGTTLPEPTHLPDVDPNSPTSTSNTGTDTTIGTCTTNGTTTQTTATACVSPGFWTPATNGSGTNNGGTTPPPSCGGAGEPACG